MHFGGQEFTSALDALLCSPPPRRARYIVTFLALRLGFVPTASTKTANPGFSELKRHLGPRSHSLLWATRRVLSFVVTLGVLDQSCAPSAAWLEHTVSSHETDVAQVRRLAEKLPSTLARRRRCWM